MIYRIFDLNTYEEVFWDDNNLQNPSALDYNIITTGVVSTSDSYTYLQEVIDNVNYKLNFYFDYISEEVFLNLKTQDEVVILNMIKAIKTNIADFGDPYKTVNLAKFRQNNDPIGYIFIIDTLNGITDQWTIIEDGVKNINIGTDASGNNRRYVLLTCSNAQFNNFQVLYQKNGKVDLGF